MKKSKIVVLLFIVVSSLPVTAAAATYYVDPQNGSDTAAGTSVAPWETVPGTRKTDNSGFLRAGWGLSAATVTQSNKVKCGDTILLKGGTTYSKQNVTNGGAWQISPTYYTNTCTASNPITIKVATAAQWSGSSGNFVVDGSGVTKGTTYVSGYSQEALVAVEQVSGMVIGGNGISQQLELSSFAPSSGGMLKKEGMMVNGVFSGTQASDIKVQYLSTHNHGGPGLTHATVRNSVFDHITSFNNIGSGIEGGGWVDQRNTNVGLTNIVIYGNGNNADLYGSGDGVNLQGPDSEWVVNAIVHDNYKKGFNLGIIENAEKGRPVNFRLRNIQVYFNGLDCTHDYPNYQQTCTGVHTPRYCCTGPGTGTCIGGACGSALGAAGDDNLTGYDVAVYVVGAIFWRNLESGFGLYQGMKMDGWQMTLWQNGWQDDNHFLYDRSGGHVGWHNSIIPKGRSAILGTNTAGTPREIPPVSNWNLYVPVTSDTETFSAFRFVGNTYSQVSTAFNGPIGFIGPQDKIGAAYNTGFTATGGLCSSQVSSPSAAGYASCNFHLQSSSSAINSGGCLFSANGASNGMKSTVTVSPNGLSSDPRDYFIEPASYLEAVGDKIRIGASSVTITSMTATSITFTPAVAWANGACIHLPYSGSAPDMGAFEYAGPVAKKPKAPTLNSARGVP